MLPGVPLRHILTGLQATTQGGDQLGMGNQAGGLHLLLHLLLAEQQGLRVEYVQVVGKAALERDHGDVVGFLCGSNRFGGEVRLFFHRLAADQLVGDVLQCTNHGLVVAGHRHVIPRRGHAQF